MQEGSAEELVPLIYEAALEPKGWNPFIESLEQALGGAAAAVHLDFVLPDPHSSFAPSFDPVHLESFYSYYVIHNPYMPHSAGLTAGQVSWGREVVSLPELEASEYYGDWMVPQRFSKHPTFVGCADRVGESGIMVAVHHREGRREFGAADAALVASLLPHLRQAGRISRRFAALGARAEALDTMLEHVPTAVVLLDGTGKLAATNTAADAILRERDGLMDREGELCALHRHAAKELALVIRDGLSAGAGHSPPAGGALRIPRRGERAPLEVIVAPLGSPTPRREGSFAVAVFITDPDRHVAPSQGVLRRLHGLTPAEAALAVRLVAGYSVSEAAEQLGITRETARTYTKRVLSKTGSRRQSDLVRRVLKVAHVDVEDLANDAAVDLSELD